MSGDAERSGDPYESPEPDPDPKPAPKEPRNPDPPDREGQRPLIVRPKRTPNFVSRGGW